MPRRRRLESRRRRTPKIQYIILGCMALFLTFYAFAFYSIIGSEFKQRDIKIEEVDNPVVPEQPSLPIIKPVAKEPAGVTVGFAVTITGCGKDPITEGAAVLKHSIHLASIHGKIGGRYDYKMYAIYHPDGETCAAPLKDLGYELLKRNTPVAVSDIQGDFLRENIEKNGCCGEKELVKLEAYTLTQHPVVVHLDLDVLVLKPLDALFDWMLVDPSDLETTYDVSEVPIMWPEMEKPQKPNAFFTRDCKYSNREIHQMFLLPFALSFSQVDAYPLYKDNMVAPKRKYKPVQGGFLVLRPDMEVYEEFVAIIKQGDFRQRGGWGGLVGPFYGSMTFQGIIPYYYDILHKNEGVELSRCIVNQMADNPKDKRTVNDIPQGRCRTDEEECEDCRNRPLEDVVTAHFTLCQKPWLCLPQNNDIIQQRLCRKLHHEWHRIRTDLEKSWGRTGVGSGTYHQEHFYGHCKNLGKTGYIPIEQPYGDPRV